jgi:hypothetical protein
MMRSARALSVALLSIAFTGALSVVHAADDGGNIEQVNPIGTADVLPKVTTFEGPAAQYYANQYYNDLFDEAILDGTYSKIEIYQVGPGIWTVYAYPSPASGGPTPPSNP